MSSNKLERRLDGFVSENKIRNKGALSVMLVITRKAKDQKGILDPASFRAKSKGQVAGLGFAAVQAILKDHGIDRPLAAEGGRTSRGSMGKMEKYVIFLNELRSEGILDLEKVEAFWVQKVTDFFTRSGLKLRYDPSRRLGATFQDLLQQAEKLQETGNGTMYLGPVLHYLVGAKLKLFVMPELLIRGASVADASSGTSGDYEVGNTAIHVTVMPSPDVFKKCAANLASGLRPMVITLAGRLEAARQIAAIMKIEDRVEIVDGPQFLTMNIYEKGRFQPATDKEALEKLIETYNRHVSELESDPAILIR